MEALTDLDRLIERRSRQSGEDRPEEVMYAESVRRYNAVLESARREAWCDYHRAQAQRHRRTLAALIDEHEQLAESLQVPQPKTKGQS